MLKNMLFVVFAYMILHATAIHAQMHNGEMQIPAHKINSHYFYEVAHGDTIIEIYTDSTGHIYATYHYVKLQNQELWISIDLPGRVEFGMFKVKGRYRFAIPINKRNRGRVKFGYWNTIKDSRITTIKYCRNGSIMR